MNRDELAGVLHVLHTVYGTEITEDLELLWWNMHQQTDANVMAEAAKTWAVTEKWFPKPAEIIETIRKVQANRRHTGPTGSHCDGTGWEEAGERSSSPCPACNPILHAVFSDPVAMGEYRDGKPLSSISDDVMSQNGTFHAVDKMPTACKQTDREDPYDPVRRRPVDQIRVGREL